MMWAVIKGWLDESRRKNVLLLGNNFMDGLLEYVDEDVIPEYLGGKNPCQFPSDYGPWNDYEIINS